LFFPEDAIVLDPLRGGLHRLRGEAAAVDAAVDFALEEAGGLENAEMLGDGGKGEWKRFGKLSDGRFALGEAGENGATRGIGKRGEGGVERDCGIVNHMVYYRRGICRCQAGFSEGLYSREDPACLFLTSCRDGAQQCCAPTSRERRVWDVGGCIFGGR
jgi:hypothetical protein